MLCACSLLQNCSKASHPRLMYDSSVHFPGPHDTDQEIHPSFVVRILSLVMLHHPHDRRRCHSHPSEQRISGSWSTRGVAKETYYKRISCIIFIALRLCDEAPFPGSNGRGPKWYLTSSSDQVSAMKSVVGLALVLGASATDSNPVSRVVAMIQLSAVFVFVQWVRAGLCQ